LSWHSSVWSWRHTAVSHWWHWLSHLLLLLTWHTHVLVLVHTWTSLVIWSLSTGIVIWSSLLSSHHVSFRVVEVGVHGLVLLHDVQQLLKDLSHVWVTGKIIKMEGSHLLSLIFFEISLIDGIFDLDSSLFLDLVMIDHQGLAIMSGVVQSGFGKGSRVWLFEADESEVSVSSFFELDVLDLTEMSEDVLELLISPVVWEVLDVKVASLL